MKYTFVSKLEINEGIGVHEREPLPVVAILPNEKRIMLRDEEGFYLPPSYEEQKPTSAGYWNFGDGIKVRLTGERISSKGTYHDLRGWDKLEVIAPKETQFVLDNGYSQAG